MSERGRKLVQLACSESPEPGGSGCISIRDITSIDPSSRNQKIINDDSNDSSDLDDSQMEISIKMKKLLEGYSRDTSPKMNESDYILLADLGIGTSMDKAGEFKVPDEEHPFGIDYLDFDPTYVPDSDQNILSNFQSDSPNPHVIDIIPESPHNPRSEREDLKNGAMLILENILDRVWTTVKQLECRRTADPIELKKHLCKVRRMEGFPYGTKGVDEDKAGDFEVSDEEHPFGSDYSDLDPTYVPDSDQNVPSNFQSDSPDPHVIVIIPESPHNPRSERENPKNCAMLILENILDRVWTIVKPLKRRRTANPNEWKKYISKVRKIEGLSYVTQGVIRSAKVPKPIQCDKCTFKCTEKFTTEEREHLCRNYYKMDYKAKKNFIISCIVVEPVKTRVVQRKTTKKERTYSKKCFFQKNNEKIQVCQKFFLATLCICVDVITDAVANTSSMGLYVKEDERGKREPVNKTKKEDVQFVKKHIEMFPVMESHYCRKDSNKQYSAPDVKSISNMYRLYLEKCEEENKAPVSESKYRDIFNSDYNLSFFSPKKDLCMTCTQYQKAVSKENLILPFKAVSKEYQEHIQRKKVCQEAKDADKVRSNTEETFMSVTMNLQKVLQMPTGGESILYYKRKLVLYNFTIYEAKLPNNAYCLCWSEINGRKGSCEIGTCLYFYLSNEIPKHIKEVSLFSDTCSGQNRNQYVSALLFWAVQKIDHLNVIEQKFLESGHSHMEVDSMHAAIENCAKNKSLHSVTDWKNVFQAARRKRTKIITTETEKKHVDIDNYKVREFKYHEILDLKNLGALLMKNKNKDDLNQTVNWLKIKRIKYVKGDYRIYFNYDMSDDFRYIEVYSEYPNQTTPKTRSKRHSNPPSVNFQLPEELEPLYQSQLPIRVAKKADLENLCAKHIIPEELHPWIHSLKTFSTKKLPPCLEDYE